MSKRGCLHFNANDTSNASYTALAAVVGTAFTLKLAYISVDTADNVAFQFNSGAKVGPFYLAANTVTPVVFGDYLFEGAPGDGLTVTKGSAGTKCTVFGLYTANE